MGVLRFAFHLDSCAHLVLAVIFVNNLLNLIGTLGHSGLSLGFAVNFSGLLYRLGQVLIVFFRRVTIFTKQIVVSIISFLL